MTTVVRRIYHNEPCIDNDRFVALTSIWISLWTILKSRYDFDEAFLTFSAVLVLFYFIKIFQIRGCSWTDVAINQTHLKWNIFHFTNTIIKISRKVQILLCLLAALATFTNKPTQQPNILNFLISFLLFFVVVCTPNTKEKSET